MQFVNQFVLGKKSSFVFENKSRNLGKVMF